MAYNLKMRTQHIGNWNFLLSPAALGLLALALAVPAGNLAEAASARCFMHGIIAPPKTKTQLSDMIRLHFDSDEKKKCELMMTSYCQIHVIEKGFATDRLQGSFRPETKGEEKGEETRYKFDPKCKLLLPSDEEEEAKRG